uniref:Shematrin-like protein 1 n=2 Tax=Panagrolaimus sp. PS1159 TaxID=55785 RepID=A0AC35F6G9_9BILA
MVSFISSSFIFFAIAATTTFAQIYNPALAGYGNYGINPYSNYGGLNGYGINPLNSYGMSPYGINPAFGGAYGNPYMSSINPALGSYGMYPGAAINPAINSGFGGYPGAIGGYLPQQQGSSSNAQASSSSNSGNNNNIPFGK